MNDDYCDCPDGSDEPGTAACTYLSALSPPQPVVGAPNTTLALPGFYCKNKGHIPGYISHTYVNDGVCDYDVCCDGSDEWVGAGGVKCEDKCKEIGKEWRRLDEIRQKSARSALKKKTELVNEAQALRAGVELRISSLQVEIKEQEKKVEDLKKKYEEVERSERGKVVKSQGKGSKVTVLAGLAKQRVEELRDALIGLINKRNELRRKVKELETILSTFKEEYNPNFNDEGVKRAVKSWEDYAAKKDAAAETDESAEDRDIEEISKPDSETEGINWAEWETEEESDVEARMVSLYNSYNKTNVPQFISLRNIFLLPSEIGFTKNLLTYASYLLRMGFSLIMRTRAASLKPSATPEPPIKLSTTTSASSKAPLATSSMTSRNTMDQTISSVPSRVPAFPRILENMNTNFAGLTRRVRKVRKEAEALEWATSFDSTSCMWTRRLIPKERGWELVSGQC